MTKKITVGICGDAKLVAQQILSKLSANAGEMERQKRTIRTSQSCQGVGLHTGVKTVITFHPAQKILVFVL